MHQKRLRALPPAFHTWGMAWSLVLGRELSALFRPSWLSFTRLDLRGHGKSEGADRLRWTGVQRAALLFLVLPDSGRCRITIFW